MHWGHTGTAKIGISSSIRIKYFFKYMYMAPSHATDHCHLLEQGKTRRVGAPRVWRSLSRQRSRQRHRFEPLMLLPAAPTWPQLASLLPAAAVAAPDPTALTLHRERNGWCVRSATIWLALEVKGCHTTSSC